MKKNRKDQTVTRAQNILKQLNCPYNKMDLNSIANITCLKRNIDIYKYQHPRINELKSLLVTIQNRIIDNLRSNE